MKIEFFEETNFSYRRKQDLEKDLNLHWIARNMAGDKVGDIPAILQVLQHPLTTESEIEKRQQVVTAACENSSVTYQLRDRIVSLSENLTRGLHAILDSRKIRRFSKRLHLTIFMTVFVRQSRPKD